MGFDIKDVERLIGDLPDDLYEAVQKAFRTYQVLKPFVDMIGLAKIKMQAAETVGRQVITAFKRFGGASSEVRLIVYTIMADLFDIAIEQWECPWALKDPDADAGDQGE